MKCIRAPVGLLDLLDRFYLKRQTTITSTDPQFVAPAIKAVLKRKNRLMRSGRIEEADAISKRVRAAVTRLRTANARKRTKETWARYGRGFVADLGSKNVVSTD